VFGSRKLIEMDPSIPPPLASDSSMSEPIARKMRVKHTVRRPPRKPKKTTAERARFSTQVITEEDPFFSSDRKDKRLSHFIKRSLDSCKHLDLNWFIENDFIFPQMLIEQGLEKFCTLSGNVYPKLVAEFYANLVKRNDNRITEVKGTRMFVNSSTLLEVAGLKDEGLLAKSIVERKWEGHNYVQTYLNCLRPNKHTEGKQLKAGSMTVDHRLLHYILVYLLIPRRHNRAQANEEDLRFIYAFKRSIQVNWADVVIAHMIRRRNDSSGALPYPILVSRIIELAGVDVSNETKLVMKSHSDIIDKATINKMQIGRFNGVWKWLEDVTPRERQAEKDKAATDSHESQFNNASSKVLMNRLEVFMTERISVLQTEMDEKNQRLQQLEERINYGITLLESLLGNEEMDPSDS